jgi:hypothetical protein
MLLLRACEAGLSSESFQIFTPGEILDVIIEKSNDNYEQDHGKVFYAGDDD